jgi:hypothetical protein
VDIMEISKPDDLGDIANLGLTLTEAKQRLARAQREISAAQAREHAGRRPVCRCRDGICRVKDYRDHAVATLFAQVALRLPRFRCAACGRIETGINWPLHCRSTPELDRLRAHLSALMTYRVSVVCWSRAKRLGLAGSCDTARFSVSPASTNGSTHRITSSSSRSPTQLVVRTDAIRFANLWTHPSARCCGSSARSCSACPSPILAAAMRLTARSCCCLPKSYLSAVIILLSTESNAETRPAGQLPEPAPQNEGRTERGGP